MRKKKKSFLIKKELLQNKIKSFHTALTNPNNKIIQKNINIHNNLCDVNMFEQRELFKNINLTADKLENDGFRTKKIKLFLNDDQKKITERTLNVLRSKGLKIATALTKASEFYPAEAYHQDYYFNNGKAPYCHGYTKRF